MRELRDAAVWYGERGYRVIPLHHTNAEKVCSCRRAADCPTPAKHPLFVGWYQVATSDIDKIAAWWRLHPRANIGLLMGGVHRLVAFDIDGESGRRSLTELEAKFGALPETWTQETGRVGGGEHRVFCTPEGTSADQIRNRIKIAPGIDVRSEGALIVAAPSRHPSGAQYQWRNHVAVQTMPDWLFRLASAPSARRAVSDCGERPPEALLPPLNIRLQTARQALIVRANREPCIQGQNGSRACLRAAILLIRGFCLPPKHAFDLMWNIYNPTCKPPWSEKELWHKIESAEFSVSVPWLYMMTPNTDPARYWTVDEKSLPNPLVQLTWPAGLRPRDAKKVVKSS